MSTPNRPRPVTVVYDPDAVAEFASAIKAKEERRAMLNAIDKLRELGDRLAPPHMKPLQGRRPVDSASCGRARAAATGVRSTARSARPTSCSGFDRHKNFDGSIARAQARVPQ